MSELEEKINRILNDPSEMEKITKLAGQIMGESSSDERKDSSSFSFDGLDTDTLKSVQKLLSQLKGADNDKKALLEALKPFLGEKRREKMDKAIRFARLAKIAELAFSEFGGNDNV